jgi:hypothetical protein
MQAIVVRIIFVVIIIIYTYTLQPSHKRPPPTSEVVSSKDNEQGDPPEESHTGGAETVDDEGLGSEIRLDRPSSAKGSRKRAPADHEAAPPINGK